MQHVVSAPVFTESKLFNLCSVCTKYKLTELKGWHCVCAASFCPSFHELRQLSTTCEASHCIKRGELIFLLPFLKYRCSHRTCTFERLPVASQLQFKELIHCCHVIVCKLTCNMRTCCTLHWDKGKYTKYTQPATCSRCSCQRFEGHMHSFDHRRLVMKALRVR